MDNCNHLLTATCVLINLSIATKFKLIEHTNVIQRWKTSDKINIEQN